MSGWLKVDVGDVSIIHHSTSSIIEIVFDDEYEGEKKIYIDYLQFEYLKKAIQSIEGLIQ